MQDFATWQARYKDGTVIRQKDEGASYEELDRSQLVEFSMWSKGNMLLLLTIPFKEGQGSRLIWRRRVIHKGNETQIFYIVGKKGAFISMIDVFYQVTIDDNFSEGVFGDITPVKGEE